MTVEIHGQVHTQIDVISPLGAKAGHEVHKCECGMTLASCRCPGPHTINLYKCIHDRPAIYGPNSIGDGMPEQPDAVLGVVHPAEKPVRPEDQQLPQPNGLPSMHDQAQSDLKARKELGASRYGVALQPCNGRDAVRDAYEEALDGAAYLAQATWEQEHPEATWVGRVINALDAQVLMPVGKRLPIFIPENMFIPPAVVSLLENRGFSIESIEE